MAQINFTLDFEDVQGIIEQSGADELSKQLLTTIFNQLMEKQRDDYIGVGEYVRNSERVSHRNGYYERDFTTRIGTLELLVPRTRDGLFSPDLFQRYQRNEKALLSAMLEMYVQGVSTRKVSRIVKELCGKAISKSFVSSLTKELDEVVEAFLSYRFDCLYPFLMSDVIYIKVRENKRVISKAFHIVLGINEKGHRNVLGFSLHETESLESWKTLYEKLIERGLKGVKLVISDAHKGEVEAIKQCFVGASWQRCQVHFTRNILDRLSKKNTTEIRNEIKALFKITHGSAAREYKNLLVEKYASVYPSAIQTLEEGFEDAFQYCMIEETSYSRLKSTNMLERVNEEIRRREKVIRIFPNNDSAIRLIGTLLIDIHEDWSSNQRQYIRYTPETIDWLSM